jgi:hypothetical protein
MPADRERLNGTDQDSSLPIADIDRGDVEATAAEKVKGGAAQTGKVSTHDLVVVKTTDTASAS